MKVFFQIGTNDGNDRFRKLVINYKPDIVILVEPNNKLIQKIEKNYSDIKNVHIYNNAVYYNNDEIVDLFISEGRNVEVASSLFSLVPMNDWGEKSDLPKISAKSITFDQICKNHNITEIEYLQIDTEGFDSEIIKMIDFTKYKINTLRFERWTFGTDCFTKHNNEKSNELGMNGMNDVKKKLTLHNYTFHDIDDEDGGDVIAFLK